MDMSNTGRDIVFQPFQHPIDFEGVFVRRKNNKNKTCYYLYTRDEETLLLCACETGSYDYDISRNAKNINKLDPYFCGSLHGNNSNQTYQGTDFNGTELISIKYKKKSERKEPFRQFSAMIPPDTKILQREPQYINGSWLLKFPTTDGISSEKNFMMDFGDNYCISFEKVHDEEFCILIRHPLSLFQAFCLALSVMRRFRKE